MKTLQIFKGNIIFTKEFGKYEIFEHGYIVIENSKVTGVYNNLPEEYNECSVTDYGDRLIIPGFSDIHLHAPQFPNLGLGLDKELMPWLETYTFPEERKYSDIEYARTVYTKLVKEIWKHGTTRCSIFGTIHKEATGLLMDLLNEAGIGGYVGKVNMDRNCPDFLKEDTEKSLKETEDFILEYKDKYERVKPIITPRFVPTCSTEMMVGLGKLAEKYNIPVQSHLSENKSEIEFVKELHPECSNYAGVYDKAGLLGHTPTIMAHCVLLEEEEIEMLSEKHVYIAHSPSSNSNLASGIAPIRKLLGRNIPIGLATDISAGHSLSMCEVIVNAAQASNIKWIQSGRTDEERPLTTPELFYLATKGSGGFFGKIGSFEEGYDFDGLVIDDRNITGIKQLSIAERLQKFIYTGNTDNIQYRYVAGKLIPEPMF